MLFFFSFSFFYLISYFDFEFSYLSRIVFSILVEIGDRPI